MIYFIRLHTHWFQQFPRLSYHGNSSTLLLIHHSNEVHEVAIATMEGLFSC